MDSGIGGKFIDALLRRLVPGSDAHLLDETIVDLFCRELPPLKSLIARRHLIGCAFCRIRQEDLEGPRAASMLRRYRSAIGDEAGGLAEHPRAAFTLWLDAQMRVAIPQKRKLFFPGIPSLPLSARIAVLSLGVAATVVLALRVWLPQPTSGIAANTLLVRAAQGDRFLAEANHGIVHQTIRIQSQSQTMERSLYWDAQGTRRLRRADFEDREAPFRSAMARAGIDWDQPISAHDYQAWHDRQSPHTDRVTIAASHLLTLTTTVPVGEVSEESLTVRDTDFHPLRRTVNFRDHETVEVAEVNFEILPWSAENASLFEPIGGLATTLAAAPNLIPSIPPFPAVQSPDQLDESELGARLILNRLHADTGEQIEIRRSPQGIEVAGLVDTEERKHQLRTELMTVPRLKLSIQSAAEASRLPASVGQVVSIQAASLSDNPSALETYLRTRGHAVTEINLLSQELFSGALTISRESQAIFDLETRFALGGQRPVMESATLVDLLYSHRERLQAALRQQRQILVSIQGIQPSAESIAASSEFTLASAAARNLALVKELTRTNATATESAEALFAGMSATEDCITVAAHKPYRKPQQNSAQSGRN